MKSTTFKGVTVTTNDIIAVMEKFDVTYPDTNEYDAWLDKDTYKYAVRHNHRLYPCKHILSQATGVDTSEFSGGETTNRVFRQLGFRVIEKPLEEELEPVEKTPVAEDINEASTPDRIKQETYRILRDTELARRIKELHGYECQICGTTIPLSEERLYIEAHHIKPLGSPHDGPDVPENIICVCPNHHVQFDYGAIRLQRENITMHPRHNISQIYIDYHNRVIFKGDE